MITTNDAALADRLRVYRNQGMRQRYQYEMQGTNYRMTDIQAAIGIPQLRGIEGMTVTRQRNAEMLIQLLSSVEGIILPQVSAGNHHVWHQFTIRITDEAKRSRDEVMSFLAKNQIGSGIYYPKLAHDYDCFRNDSRIHLTETPVANNIVNEVLSIPVHQNLSEQDVELIAEKVKQSVQS